MIPKILHQLCFNASLCERYVRCRASWERLHPGWDLRLWWEPDQDALVREHLPWSFERFAALPSIQRADVFRYLLLWLYGGIYADLDVTCVRPFDPWCEERRAIAGAESAGKLVGRHTLGTAVLGSPPRHPLWMFLLRRIGRSLRPKRWWEPYVAYVSATTGPLQLTRAWAEFPTPGDLRELPTGAFYPLLPSVSHGRFDPDAEGQTIYAIHHYASGWLGRDWRRTARYIHAGLMPFAFRAGVCSGPASAALLEPSSRTTRGGR